MSPPCSIREPPDQMTRSLPPPPRPSPPTFNSHSPAAPPANASGFLLTALSNARPNLVAQHSSCLRASDKALTSLGRNHHSLLKALGARCGQGSRSLLKLAFVQ